MTRATWERVRRKMESTFQTKERAVTEQIFVLDTRNTGGASIMYSLYSVQVYKGTEQIIS